MGLPNDCLCVNPRAERRDLSENGYGEKMKDGTQDVCVSLSLAHEHQYRPAVMVKRATVKKSLISHALCQGGGTCVASFMCQQ